MEWYISPGTYLDFFFVGCDLLQSWLFKGHGSVCCPAIFADIFSAATGFVDPFHCCLVSCDRWVYRDSVHKVLVFAGGMVFATSFALIFVFANLVATICFLTNYCRGR